MEMICIVCPKGCHLTINSGEVSGQGCEKGVVYAKNELTNPTRVVTSTVIVSAQSHSRLPVKTDAPISKALVKEAVKLLTGVRVISPVKCGDIIVANILGTNVNFVATRNII